MLHSVGVTTGISSIERSTTIPLLWPAFCVCIWNISKQATSWNTWIAIICCTVNNTVSSPNSPVKPNSMSTTQVYWKLFKTKSSVLKAVVIDFSKAFDEVSHDRLIYKLDRAGIDKQTRNYIKSFPSGRSQKVIIDVEESKSVLVTSGVPQESVLGLILFLVLIDERQEYTKHSQIFLFADDMIIYLTVSATNDCEKLQDDLKRLEKWEEDWQMEFHPAKCNVQSITRKRNRITLPYTLHGHVLEEVTSAKYLGINMINDMTWNEHIEKMTSEETRSLDSCTETSTPVTSC